MSANKREYESTSNYVTYRFDLTGTFEALTNDGDAWVDQFGFRLDFDSQFDSPVTVDFIDSPASSERVQSGIDLSGTSYDASGATEAAIEVAITELIVAAGFVSSSYVTVGSLMWALFKGFNTSVTNDDNEVRFNKNLGDPYRKRANLGYHGLELTLDPSETEGVTIEAFNDTGGYTYSTSEHFYLNDH